MPILWVLGMGDGDGLFPRPTLQPIQRRLKMVRKNYRADNTNRINYIPNWKSVPKGQENGIGDILGMQG